MSVLDMRLPDDGKAILDMAKRFMSVEVAPGVLERDALSEPGIAALAAIEELGLVDVLAQEEIGTSEQRFALLLSLGRVMGATDAGVAMSVLTSALTERACGARTGYGVEIRRLEGRGAVVFAAARKSLVLVDESGSASVVRRTSIGLPLLGLRSGGGLLLDLAPSPGETLSPEVLAPLRRELALAALSVAIGVAEGSHSTANEYAAQRYQGGSMISEHPAVRQMLDAMVENVSQAEALLAASLDDGEGPSWNALVMKALDACELAVTNGVQVLGGYGYMREYGQEKRMRDAKTLQLLFGPSRVVYLFRSRFPQ